LTEAPICSHYVLGESSDQKGNTFSPVDTVQQDSLIRGRLEKLDQFKEVKRLLSESSIPIEGKLRDHLISITSTLFKEVMKSHSGHVAEAKRESLQTTLELFIRSKLDLVIALDDFDALSREADLLPRSNPARVKTELEKNYFAFLV
jgi:hypothetical protein